MLQYFSWCVTNRTLTRLMIAKKIHLSICRKFSYLLRCLYKYTFPNTPLRKIRCLWKIFWIKFELFELDFCQKLVLDNFSTKKSANHVEMRWIEILGNLHHAEIDWTPAKRAEIEIVWWTKSLMYPSQFSHFIFGKSRVEVTLTYYLSGLTEIRMRLLFAIREKTNLLKGWLYMIRKISSLVV